MSAFSSLFGAEPLKVDQEVATLFKASSGPVSRKNLPSRTEIDVESEEEEESGSDEESEEEEKEEEQPAKKKAKTQKDENYDLEAKYFDKLYNEPEKEQEKKEKKEKVEEEKEEKEENEEKEESDSESDSEGEGEESKGSKEKSTKAKTIDLKEQELEKAEKTVFVGNVSNGVITSRQTYKRFKKLFSEYGKILSIRFRSISFNDAVPRKVAFARKSLHDARDTVNAYVVFQNKEESLRATKELNASIFDDNHIRVDHITHPSPKDNKRTIFVGNLDFEEQEETLWRYFNKNTNNDVESVRVVRDSKTNLGKGFALVQFKDTLSVNKALLLNDKPMNDEKKLRKLRISRAKTNAKPSILSPNHIDNQKGPNQKKNIKVKKPRHKNSENLSDQQKTKLGRAQSVLGKADRATVGKSKTIVEGQRAHKGDSIAGIKGLKSDRERKKNQKGNVKKPRIRERSTKFKQERAQMKK